LPQHPQQLPVSQLDHGGERFGSPAQIRIDPATRAAPLRNANSSASAPQRRLPCHCSNVAALRIKRRFQGLRGEFNCAQGSAAPPCQSMSKIIFTGDVDPDA
jgi:hypothetical protein